jgi:hypothetical protein
MCELDDCDDCRVSCSILRPWLCPLQHLDQLRRMQFRVWFRSLHGFDCPSPALALLSGIWAGIKAHGGIPVPNSHTASFHLTSMCPRGNTQIPFEISYESVSLAHIVSGVDDAHVGGSDIEGADISGKHPVRLKSWIELGLVSVLGLPVWILVGF